MKTLKDYSQETQSEVKQVRELVSNLHDQLIKWNLVVWTAEMFLNVCILLI